jgi:hypothetical protein
MLDTLGVSVPIFLEYEIIKDWDFKYTEPFWKSKKYRLKNGASIFFKYNTFTHILHFQFSASKIQHGTNARPYDFSNSVVVESEIEKAIETILGGIYIETCFLNICRVDLNKDFVFENEKDANAFMDFAKKILPARCETRKNYETGFTSQTTNAGNGFRVYRKDLDKHLKKKVREKMPPTVRIEFQMNRKFATKFYGKRFNLHEILTNELAAKMVWNKQLRKYGLDKKIVNRKTLDKIAGKYLTETQQKILVQMNDEPEFEDKKIRRKQLGVIREMKAIICPYSCEIEIDLKESTIEEIINFSKKRELKKWEISLQQNTKSQTQSIRRITKFIDDSS